MHTKAIKWYIINRLQLVIHVKKNENTVYTLFDLQTAILAQPMAWVKTEHFCWGYEGKTLFDQWQMGACTKNLSRNIHSFVRSFIRLFIYLLFIGDARKEEITSKRYKKTYFPLKNPVLITPNVHPRWTHFIILHAPCDRFFYFLFLGFESTFIKGPRVCRLSWNNAEQAKGIK